VARLAAKQQTGVAPLCRYITAHGPSTDRLLNAARAIFVLPGIFKWEGLGRAQVTVALDTFYKCFGPYHVTLMQAAISKQRCKTDGSLQYYFFAIMP